MKESRAFYAGSFDPFTIGHKSIVDRALEVFDSVIIAVGYNENKKAFLPVEQRINDIRNAFKDEKRVEVVSYSGLTVEEAKRQGATALLRGVRDVADFETERNLADINREISGIDTVILFSLPSLAFVSSSMVRELAHNGYDIKKYLP